jgi:hypothetical protein
MDNEIYPDLEERCTQMIAGLILTQSSEVHQPAKANPEGKFR